MIGVFDSGLGGLSVLAAIAKSLPRADLCYLADIAHVPYGGKSDACIRERTLAIGHYLAGQTGCRLLVVACNTATAAAIATLRKSLPVIPVVGVEPGVKPAAATSKSGRIAVLVTESTARSERLASLVERYAKNVVVDILPCPGWADRVEAFRLEGPELVDSVRSILSPALEAGADRIVLGCTHYSFLSAAIRQIAAGRAELVDVATAVAEQCVRLAGDSVRENARLTLLATAQPERLHVALPRLGLGFLQGRQSGPVMQVSI